MNSSIALEAMSPEMLTTRLDQLVAHERTALVDFLRHLAELDRRKLYLALGHASLYDYCRDHLRLSDGSAFRRYTAARLIARFPAIAEHLATGALSLKRVTMLRNVLTPENHVDLLRRASAGTELEVQALAASFAPKPDVKDSIRRAPQTALTTRIAQLESATWRLPPACWSPPAVLLSSYLPTPPSRPCCRRTAPHPPSRIVAWRSRQRAESGSR